MARLSGGFRISSLCILYLSKLLFDGGAVSFAVGQAPAPKGQSVEVTAGVALLLPAPWFVAERTKNALEIVYPLEGENRKLRLKPGEKPRSAEQLTTAAARMAVEVQPYATHADALRRLGQIASETPERSSLTVIAGWPAIERRRLAPLPTPGEPQARNSGQLALYLTTAIAADTLLTRFETAVPSSADSRLADLALAIARSIRVKPGNPQIAQSELGVLSRSIVLPPSLPRELETPPERKVPPQAPTPPRPGVASVQGGLGELEVAVSNDGQHVVVAANSGFSYSDDRGQTFRFGGGTPCVYNVCDGDPSLAVGKSGAIYYSWIGFPTNEPGKFPPPNGTTDTVSVSTDNGHTFTFAGNAVLCPSKDPNICFLPDQPHIAADRFSLSIAGLDRVYLVWRNFANAGLTTRIVCSIDGGLTWQQQTTVDSAGDYPRVSVGSDGSVYVTYISGSSIMLRKFSACDSGLTPQPTITVASYVSPSACGDSPTPAALPGLDRCNDGNIIYSPTVAVDTTNPNHVYVAWGTSTSSTNENIMVADSMDGGGTFPRSTVVNTTVTARRFMPWACSMGGMAWVSWYDRRAATTANNDLTDYFLGAVSSANGSLQPQLEVNLSMNPDPQCATGWPCSTFEVKDATSCSVQPQLAGSCSISGARCNFANPTQCQPGEQCVGNRGCPKYGDYNGNACGPGGVYTAWASATAPPGLPPTNGISIFSSFFALPDIQITNLFERRNGRRKEWCATVTATEAGRPVSGSVVINGISGVTNQQICFTACYESSSDVECDPGRKPPCRRIREIVPVSCDGTVTIVGLSPIQISVGPP